MAETFDIPWPYGGLSENVAYSKQAPTTSRDEQNVRDIDPLTGRIRGAQRSGMTKYLTAQINGANKVANMAAVTYSNKSVTYEAIADDSLANDITIQLPSGLHGFNGAMDRQDNLWLVDGFTIYKYNQDGTLLQSVPLPLKDPLHVARALWIDSQDRVYVGVTQVKDLTFLGSSQAYQLEGTAADQSECRIWCYKPAVDETMELLWEIVTGAYVSDLREKNGLLYTAQNDPDRYRSKLVVYQNITTTVPGVKFERVIPYPATKLDVNESGEIFVGAEDFADRGTDPKSPFTGPITVGWTPKDLTNYKSIIWSWYDARRINKYIGNLGLENDDPVPIWHDLSDNNRHLYQDTDHGNQAPTFREASAAGLPSIKFNGIDQVLASKPSESKDPEFADSQLTSLPGYETGMWLTCMLVRLPEDDDSTNGIRPIFSAWNDTESFAHAIYYNRSAGDSIPGTHAQGFVSLYDEEAGSTTAAVGAGTNGQPLGADFREYNHAGSNNDHRVVLLTWLHDGGVDPPAGAMAAQTATTSLFRVNGNPIDRWISKDLGMRKGEPVFLGWSGNKPFKIYTSITLNQNYGDFEILEWITFKNMVTTGEPKIMTHPKYGQDPGGADLANAGIGTPTNLERVEGYLAHRWGVSNVLPASDSGTAPNEVYTHSYASAAPVTSAQSNQADPNALNGVGPLLVKYSPSGELIWVVDDEDGVGYGVKVNSDGNIYATGPVASLSDSDTFRLILDNGDDYDATGSGTWSDTTPDADGGTTREIPTLALDEFDNVYIPVKEGSGTDFVYVSVYAKDDAVTDPIIEFSSGGAGTSLNYGVVIPNVAPTYDDTDDFTAASPGNVKRAEYMWILQNSTGGAASARKIQLVAKTAVTTASRAVTTLGVSNGDINVFTTSGVSTPSGGSSALSTTARYIQSAVAYQKAYFVDGITYPYQTYDPVTGLVTDWESTSSGKIPEGAQLITIWRGRVMLGRFNDDPQNWAMSRKDEPNNWDFFPAVPDGLEAVIGNNSLAGRVPEVITAMISYNDDILLFGCDHSIWRLNGDPAAGGQIDLVSDITGIAYGKAWAKDPDGAVYFFGSQGGLYVMPPGGQPQRLSLDRIERQLQAIDMDAFRIELAWNQRDEGLHIFQMPYGAGGTVVDHWFWERKTNAFHRDVFGTAIDTDKQPTSVITLDGDDPDDRVLLLGCEDGRVRMWDRDALDDDGLATDSYVTIGPMNPQGVARESRFKAFTAVLANDQSGVQFQLFSTPTPDVLGQVLHQGVLNPGRNPTHQARMRGSYCFLRLRSSVAQRWAFEEATMEWEPAGRKRVRS